MSKDLSVEYCRVKGCESKADFEVILYDFYASDPAGKEMLFYERDFTCPRIMRR